MAYRPSADYRIALNHDVALAALANIQTTLHPSNYRVSGGLKWAVGIWSPVLDPYPVRTQAGDGWETGDGFINTYWLLTLARFGVKALMDTYFSSGTVVSANATIYTRRHLHNDYTRYNCILHLPSSNAGDITPLRSSEGVGDAFKVRLRMTDLMAL